MPTTLIIILAIVLILILLVIFGFYRPLLDLNRRANSFLAEIEDGLSRRSEMIKKITGVIKDNAKDPEIFLKGFAESEKSVSKATNISELARGDEIFIDTFYTLLASNKLPSSLKSDYNFCRLLFKILEFENSLKDSRMAYNSTADLINRKLKNPVFLKINKVFGKFPVREKYELGSLEKSRIEKLLKINYE